MSTYTSLIIGAGEIGRALRDVLEDFHDVDIRDKDDSVLESKYQMLHICFGYSDSFITEVTEYQKLYNPEYTIIHSTVKPGTSRACNALHSPIRGKHPHLAESIKLFPKFIGGEKASEAANYFRRAGIKVILFDKQETTETAKIFDTEYYRTCINFCKRVKHYCDNKNLNFHEVYTIANQTYNESYAKLGYPEFVRPVLQPIMTPIGGHCVEQNKELLNA